MAKKGRIPTPRAQLWRRFRYSYLPVATFVLLTVTVLALWRHHSDGPMMTGEFYALSRDARSGIAGQLVDLEGRPNLQVGDEVNRGEVVARLDAQPVELALTVANSRLDELKKQIFAEHENQRIAQLDRKINLTDSQIRRESLAWQYQERIDDLQLRVNDHKVVMKFDELILKTEGRKLLWLNNLIAKQLLGRSVDEFDAEVARDMARQRLAQSTNEMARLNALIVSTKGKLTNLQLKYPEIKEAGTNSDLLLDPLRTAVETQLAVLEEVKWQLQALDITAPISGFVRTIHHTPGQPVLAGEPIVTIASRANTTIVGYVRQEQDLRVQVGDRVAVKVRSRPKRTVEGMITRVGAHQEEMPVQHRRQKDPNILEWGVPVWIELSPDQIPEGIPGTLVDFRPLPRTE